MNHPLPPHLAAHPLPIEDYALIGDSLSAALVGRNGSIDWMCWPRFDSAACFAALLGDSRNGRWLIAPREPHPRVTRAYRDGTLILETLFETAEGSVALIDFMPAAGLGGGLSGVPGESSVVRIVEGRSGQVEMQLELALRFDYGASVPWVTRLHDTTLPEGHSGIVAIAGPDLAVLRGPVKLTGRHLTTFAEFTVRAGERLCFALRHGASHLPPPPSFDEMAALARTETDWRAWSARCRYAGRWREPVTRSLITLKALTYAPTGGIVAAATTSLPELLGGSRNWDYRFCWLRDATLTLLALMEAGYFDEAAAWRDWLHRSVAGSPQQVQIMYGLSGERRLAEWEVPWLPGYQGSAPVRIGNAASGQVQLDVYGELMDALHHARDGGLSEPGSGWSLQSGLLRHLEAIWQSDDEGIWEVRGGRRPFTFSKIMAWVAMDRAVRDMERWKLPGPLDRWRALRDEIHRTTCREGFNAARNSFTQSFGSTELDASLLLIPVVGFLPASDPRVSGTLAAIESELLVDGFVRRYRTESGHDGLPPGEGVFLACSFWLADHWKLAGRTREAYELFDRLAGLRNDVGLLSEEYDPAARRLIGNFPQAFSHIALIGTALHLEDSGAVARRSRHGRGKVVA
jgi:GH15 family glucan-1,4-alpha-glucosidase